MSALTRSLFFIGLLALASDECRSQTPEVLKTLSTNNLDAFRPTGKNWNLASNASADPEVAGNLQGVPGEGTLVNLIMPTGNQDLVTREEFGDLQLELDFMMSLGSNSGVYLQGRYEVQLFDSWKLLRTVFSDCGGIYERWDDARGVGKEGFEGSPPLMNTSKAPGLWQHLKVVFRAPRFDSQGMKTANARFDEVYLNGVLVQTAVSLTGPTRGSMFKDEQPLGPVRIQGDHGNVAFRNIRYGKPEVVVNKNENDDPILIDPQGRPYLLRSYLMHRSRKLTHVISYGHPDKLNYSYDLKQGALLQAWRGDYLDVTEMWHERGEPQLAKPRGSLLMFNDAPALAILSEPGSSWPDSLAFDELRNEGYTLDADRTPTFQYSIQGMQISDKISGKDPQGITRELAVKDPKEKLYFRVAVDSTIAPAGKNMYIIGDRGYYLRLDDRYKPIIRRVSKGMELLVPIDKLTPTMTYSIIF
jgi:hypothetical protein